MGSSWRLLALALLLLVAVGGAHAGRDDDEARRPKTLWACLARVSGLRVVANASNPVEYAAAAEGWNRLYSSSPLAVIYPQSDAAVSGAVRCARSFGARIVPRSGGNSFMGYSERDGMLTLDLKEMSGGVRVSRDKRSVTFTGGARLGDLYYQVWLQAGPLLSVNAGTCPSVGVGGHILGGGFGFISMLHGAACDQLVSLKIVDARGNLHYADKRRNADLFAASCGGGGGNFGIVTEMTLALVPVAPLYTQGNVEIPADKAAAWLEHYDRTLNDLAHPALFMEPRLDKLKVRVGLSWPGDQASLEAELRRIDLLGPGSNWTAATTVTSPKSGTWMDAVVAFAGAQAQGTPESLTNFTYGRTKRDAAGFQEFSYCPTAPTAAADYQRVLNLLQEIGSSMKWKRAGPNTAVGRVAPGATGFRWRKALWCSQLSDRWKTAAEAAVGVANLERANAVFAPIFGLQSYVNYLEDSLPLEAFYGANLPWLRRVKRRWDPEGYFSTNALSIPPARADGRRDS